ncbi:MAG: YfhO family protein [Acidiferrobacteraceae bacterium]
MFRSFHRAGFADSFLWSDSISPLRSNLFGAVILFLLVNLTFAPFIWGDRTFQESANGASSLYAAGSRQWSPVRHLADNVLDPGSAAWQGETDFAVEHHIIFSEKEPPIWNPYASFGTPLAADAESQPYYPLAWVPIVWSNARGYDIFIALRIFIGGLFAFLFLRQFVRFIPALVGSVAFIYSGYYWLYITMQHISVEVLLPAILYGLERVLRRPGFGTAALLSIVVACLVLGGMPESTTLAFAFGAFYFIARIALDSSLRSQWRAWLSYLALGTVVGIGISAIMLIPLLEYLPVSWNFHSGAPPGLDVDALSWSTAATYLAPLYLGPPWGNIFGDSGGWTALRGFFGCSSLFFAQIAFFSSIVDIVKRRPQGAAVPLVLGIVAVALLAKRFGVGLVNWVGALPVLREIIFYKYEEAIIGCCVALLAGFGVSRLCEKRATMGSIWLAALIPLAILTAAASENRQAFLRLSQNQDYYLLGLSAALIFLGLAGMAVIAFYAGRINLTYFALATLVLVIVEPLSTYIIPLHYVVDVPPLQSTSALLGAPYIDYLKSHLIDNDRLYAQDGLLYPQWSGVFNLADVRGENALYYKRYLPFVRAFLTDSGGDNLTTRFIGSGDDITTPLSQRFLALSSVRYVATTSDLPRSNAFRRTYDVDGVQVFQFGSPLPRISIFHHVVNASTPRDALRDITSNTFDPYSEAVAEGQSPTLRRLSDARHSLVSAGHIEEYKSTFVKALVKADGTAFVVLNDTNFPGWSASVDGRSTPIFAANYLFRGIIVPSGIHTIEYYYNPRSFVVGFTISLISLFVLVGMALVALLARTRGTTVRATSHLV